MLCFLVIILAMDEKPRKDSFFAVNSTIHNDESICDSLIRFAKKYINKPYCYGSKVPKCFDCSGYAQHVFLQFGTKLNSSASQIALQGKFISFKNAVAGDLVFFNGRNANDENIGHVGIVVSSNQDTIRFIHASVQAGVIISHSKESYYQKRLLFVKRIPIR